MSLGLAWHIHIHMYGDVLHKSIKKGTRGRKAEKGNCSSVGVPPLGAVSATAAAAVRGNPPCSHCSSGGGVPTPEALGGIAAMQLARSASPHHKKQDLKSCAMPLRRRGVPPLCSSSRPSSEGGYPPPLQQLLCQIVRAPLPQLSSFPRGCPPRLQQLLFRGGGTPSRSSSHK